MRTLIAPIRDSWIKGQDPSKIEIEWHYKVYEDGSAAVTVDSIMADEEEVFFKQFRVLMVESDHIEADSNRDWSTANFKIDIDSIDVADEEATLYLTYKQQQ